MQFNQYIFKIGNCGGENFSLCVGLKPHSLIIMRPRRRKYGKMPRNR